ncbi:hypothetical protein E2C01_014217 [Portunus trituberculatus]|uniref:Uncharacterized protein n=1 Tax=Portunus trituberculatus TaxID=210409 RepID=A0A5B7DJJ4_PORTR|nr:hypothetical protein [Portunus trituberculatus]
MTPRQGRPTRLIEEGLLLTYKRLHSQTCQSAAATAAPCCSVLLSSRKVRRTDALNQYHLVSLSEPPVRGRSTVNKSKDKRGACRRDSICRDAPILTPAIIRS